MTMIGTGLELGLRNTMWLGSGGIGNPYGIVKDQLEMRWSEPYWKDADSDWTVFSRLELTSLHATESSSLARFLKPVKRMSLEKFVNEVEIWSEFSPKSFTRLPLYLSLLAKIMGRNAGRMMKSSTSSFDSPTTASKGDFLDSMPIIRLNWFWYNLNGGQLNPPQTKRCISSNEIQDFRDW